MIVLSNWTHLGQCRQDDHLENSGLRGRDAHHAHAGVQHQVSPVGGVQAQRLGHWRPEEDSAVLEKLLRKH